MRRDIRNIWLASFRANWFLCTVVFTIFVLGCTLGVFAVDYLSRDQINELSSYLDVFISQSSTIQIDSQQAAKTSIINNVSVVLIIYLAGLTVLGIPIVLALLFIRGFALGFAFGFLAKQKAWEGTLLAVVSILPQNIIYIPAIVIGAVASISFSILLVKRYFDSRIGVWSSFMGYSILMLGMAAIAVGAGLVEAYITPWMIRSAAILLAG